MRMRSPNLMNGVAGLPCSIVSQHAPLGDAGASRPRASRLETVPEPTIVPASSCARLGGMGDQLGKSKVMSVPALGWPNAVPFSVDEQRQMSLAAVPGVAQFVRRHRHRREGGRAACRGRSRSPWPARRGSGCAATTSLTSITSLMCRARRCGRDAHRHVVGDRPRPRPRNRCPRPRRPPRCRRCGPMKLSDPPWYISGSVQKLGGISAPRALRTSSTCVT